ncbi:MAG: hypothetical protein H6Q90_2719 [Deltaproteobacteria bacterium]|nr:hypothetical protein [Deltaproteobacteria bacterium]
MIRALVLVLVLAILVVGCDRFVELSRVDAPPVLSDAAIPDAPDLGGSDSAIDAVNPLDAGID